eukprot:277054-Rhodomonas_salina.1
MDTDFSKRGDELKRVESGVSQAGGRSSADIRRGRSSLDIVRRISADVQRAILPEREDANIYAGLAHMAHRLSQDVSRVSLDAKRPGRRTSQEMEIMGPSDHASSFASSFKAKGGDLETTAEEDSEPFVPSHGITSAEAATLLEKWGRNEL